MGTDNACRRQTASASGESSVLTTNRQAIVIIHGIGNQRPMDTLRPFVDAVLGVDAEHDRKLSYYSKPDDLAGIFELRRLQSRDSRPRTDYFELYWQHLVPAATWAKIWAWLILLLRRSPQDVPDALRMVWRLTRWVAVSCVFLLLWGAMAWWQPTVFPFPAWLQSDPAFPAALAVLLLLAEGLVLNYVGDAAIYLSPTPENIKARQAVREAGVALIERLHASDNGKCKYDRIVIVGHSLGSVIGYDILTHAWPRFNERHQDPPHPSNRALKAANVLAQQLWDAAAGDGQACRRLQSEWGEACRQAWIEQRANGFPWLVSDFITLGSPLAHGLLLLARSRAEFETKQRQRELPTSPPRLDDERHFYFERSYCLEAGGRRALRVLNHAALFAVTKWTNLYFPARWLLKGDLIGGPLGEVFGPGVQDVAVSTRERKGWLAHTSYWTADLVARNNPVAALGALIRALDLRRKTFSGSGGRADVPPVDRSDRGGQ